MTDLEAVTGSLDAVKRCVPSDFHPHFSAALTRFRFVPAAERRACADAFFRWADGRAAEAPLLRAYGLFLQAIDRFIAEEMQASLGLLSAGPDQPGNRALSAEAGDPEAPAGLGRGSGRRVTRGPGRSDQPGP